MFRQLLGLLPDTLVSWYKAHQLTHSKFVCFPGLMTEASTDAASPAQSATPPPADGPSEQRTPSDTDNVVDSVVDTLAADAIVVDSLVDRQPADDAPVVDDAVDEPEARVPTHTRPVVPLLSFTKRSDKPPLPPPAGDKQLLCCILSLDGSSVSAVLAMLLCLQLACSLTPCRMLLHGQYCNVAWHQPTLPLVLPQHLQFLLALLLSTPVHEACALALTRCTL